MLGLGWLFVSGMGYGARTADGVSVVVPAQFIVSQGKLQLAWADTRSDERLVALYHGDAALARTFKERVLVEVNATLADFNPLIDWKAESGRDQSIRDFLPDPAELRTSREFTGPLKAWLDRFVSAGEGGRLMYWRPTSPARTSDEDESDAAGARDDPLTSVLVLSATSLIGQIWETELGDINPLGSGRLLVHFRMPTPLARVVVAGMEFRAGTAGDAAERTEFLQHTRERERLETQLTRWAGDVTLAWNDDLAVQRLMAVFRARGYWNGYARAQPGAPRKIHWLAFNPTGTCALVHLPHLSALVFEPGVDDAETIQRVAAALLRPAEQKVVATVLERQENYPHQRAAPHEFRRMHAIIQRLDGRRIVDLFALDSYLGFQHSGATGQLYPPLPLRQDWLAARIAPLEAHGLVVNPAPAGTDENRLFTSTNRRRKTFERGGVEVWISPRAQEKPVEPAAAASAFGDWFKRQQPRAEFGVSMEDSEPATLIGRLSTTDGTGIGQLGLEVRHQKRWSGTFDWKPAERAGGQQTVLPSVVSVFSDSPPPRAVDGLPVALEWNGLRASKHHILRRNHLGDEKGSWFDVAMQVARVRDLAAAASPRQDEAKATFGFGTSAASNVWDARAYRGARLQASVVGRGHSQLAWWTLGEANFQLCAPYGDWAYYGNLDVRHVAGSAAPDAFPYLGGSTGVRGVRPYAAAARTHLILRQELWTPLPWLGRDIGSDQRWFGTVYETLKPALFVDTGWVAELHDPEPTAPWFFSPGIGFRLILGPAHLSFDYAYGLTRPARLGGHRFSLGVAARY